MAQIPSRYGRSPQNGGRQGYSGRSSRTRQDGGRDLAAKIRECKKRCEELRAAIKAVFTRRAEENPAPLRDAGRESEHPNKVVPVVRMRQQKLLRGHFGKIYSLDLSSQGDIATGAQDEKVIIWSLQTGLKKEIISPKHSSVMSLGFSPSGDLLALGGLDNICAIYRISQPETTRCDLSLHEGYVSRCQFLNEDEILTASGDGSCILWDTETRSPKCKFQDHKQDVMYLDALPQDGSSSQPLVLSASTDGCVKLWDFRVAERHYAETTSYRGSSPRRGKGSPSLSDKVGCSPGGCVASVMGHDGEVLCCRWFPSYDYTFASGGEDGVIRLFDVRAMRQMNAYEPPRNEASGDSAPFRTSSITSLVFTRAGKLIFAGYDESPYCIAYDTLSGEPYTILQHEEDVSALAVSHDGYAVVSGSWDQMARIWV